MFSPDGRHLLTWDYGGTAYLLSLPTPWPAHALKLQAQVETGTRLDDDGELQLILYDEWKVLKREYDRICRTLDPRASCHRSTGSSDWPYLRTNRSPSDW